MSELSRIAVRFLITNIGEADMNIVIAGPDEEVMSYRMWISELEAAGKIRPEESSEGIPTYRLAPEQVSRVLAHETWPGLRWARGDDPAIIIKGE